VYTERESARARENESKRERKSERVRMKEKENAKFAKLRAIESQREQINEIICWERVERSKRKRKTNQEVDRERS